MTLEESLPLLAALFLVVGALYASVGHAGASGYLAVMALVGVEAAIMRPTALSINLVVASIAFTQFHRAGHFSWPLIWPLAVASTPAAFLGGMIPLPNRALQVAIGITLILAAARMVWTAAHASQEPREPAPPGVAPALACGAVLGFVAGVTGTGGGIFLSPLLLLMRWADTKQTAAVASLFILLNSAAGIAGIATSGWTPTPALALLATAAAAGGFLGAAYGSRRATPTALRILLACVLLVAGAKLLM